MNKCKFKICLAIVIIVIVSFFICNLENKNSIVVKPLMNTGDQLLENRELKVTRTGIYSDGFLMSSSLISMVTSMSSKTEWLNTYNELLEKCNDAHKQKKELNIPKGAGFIDAGGIKIYTWKKTGEKLITHAKFGEIKVILLCGNSYIAAGWEVSEFNMYYNIGIETGTVN